jgi:hypothetical protein
MFSVSPSGPLKIFGAAIMEENITLINLKINGFLIKVHPPPPRLRRTGGSRLERQRSEVGVRGQKEKKET